MGEIPSEKTTALLYTTLSYRLPITGSISIPIGMIPGNLSKYSPNGGPCGDPGTTAVYINQGSAEFDFRIPTDLHDIDIENLKLNFHTDVALPNLPDISIQNWATGEWITYIPQVGVNLIPHTDGLIRHDGLIRVKIDLDNQNLSGCYFVAIGLDGKR